MGCSAETEPKPKPKPKPRGIMCPDCAVPLHVLRTRGYFNILTRRRYCRDCGRRVTTEERPVTRPAPGS